MQRPKRGPSLEFLRDLRCTKLADPGFRIVAGLVQVAFRVIAAEVAVRRFYRGIAQKNGRVALVLQGSPRALEGARQLHVEPLQILHCSIPLVRWFVLHRIVVPRCEPSSIELVRLFRDASG